MLFIDVDAMAKLAHWKILPELPMLLSTTWDNTATLTSLEIRARRAASAPDNKLFHSVDAATLMLAILCKMKKPNTSTVISELVDTTAIDSGEAVLLSQVAGADENLFLTGDKRAISALAKLQVAEKFTGKIIVVEQIILASLNVFGSGWLLDHICPFRDLDKMIQIVLGSDCNANEASIREGLTSYIKSLADLHTPSLLYKLV